MGDTGVIEGLLAHNANMDLCDKDNCSALSLAIRREHFEAAQVLIDAGTDVNRGGGMFGSPLHLAVRAKRIPLT